MADEGIFEIREYIDEDGNEIRSEKISMQEAADEVKAAVPDLLERVREAQRRREEGGGGGAAPAGGGATTTALNGGGAQEWSDVQQKVAAMHLEEEKWKRSKEEIERSRATLQGTGWKTGFLCGSAPNTSSRSSIHRTTTPTKPALKKSLSEERGAEGGKRSRSVSFDVRETTAVIDAVVVDEDDVPDDSMMMTSSPSSATSTPMAFSGVVRERGMDIDDGLGGGGGSSSSSSSRSSSSRSSGSSMPVPIQSSEDHSSLFRRHRMAFDHHEGVVPHDPKSEE